MCLAALLRSLFFFLLALLPAILWGEFGSSAFLLFPFLLSSLVYRHHPSEWRLLFSLFVITFILLFRLRALFTGTSPLDGGGLGFSAPLVFLSSCKPFLPASFSGDGLG